jgi:uncharacterized repeat protein (TIGR01451 family)
MHCLSKSITVRRAYGAAIVCLLFVMGLPGPVAAAPHAEIQPTRPTAEYGALPERFEANLGQHDARARFIARGDRYNLFLTSSGAVLSLADGALRMSLANASAEARIAGEDQLPGSSNYLVGNDPALWRTDVPGFARVRYTGIYPGVDMVYYGSRGELEYDFVLAPGANPKAIAMAFEGADRVEVASNGDLVLHVGSGEMRQKAPFAYQDTANGRVPVASRYRVSGNTVGVDVSSYDAALPLVIDPVLSYSTYLGGGDVDRGFAIAVDGTGSAYVAGFTMSTDFPLASASQPTSEGQDIFISKLTPAGSSLVYSTYIGGSGSDMARALALTSSGEVFLTGTTDSANFPAGAGGMKDRGLGVDAFVVRLSADGDTLVYSAVFGGDGADTPNGIAVDADDSAFITGETNSNDYPTQNPIQIHSGAGNVDAFVSRLDATGSVFFYSTYLGGSDTDTGFAITVDGTGNAFLAGTTASDNFPTRQPLQVDNAGAQDGFLTEIASTGTSLVFSTYFGGGASDSVRGIDLDASGAIYVAGETFSSDFPTQAPMQATPGGGGDAFVAKFAAGGGSLSYSTYIGGGGDDQANGIIVDTVGAVYITGFTRSTNFPTQLPIQTDPDGAGSDAFVAKVTVAGTRLAYSTYLGGNGDDRGDAIAIDGSGGAYVTGTTLSSNFPLQSPIHGDRAVEDAFVTKIANSVGDLVVGVTDSPSPVNSGSQLSYFITVSNAGIEEAGDIIVTAATPAGTTFASITEPEGVDCTTPPVGGTGPITCRINAIPGGGAVSLTLVVNVTAAAGTQLTFTASATTTAVDTNPTNNSFLVRTDVIEAVDPPVITSVAKLVVAGKPYRIKISGSNFQTGAQVFVGADATPWPSVKNKGNTMLILKGDTLKSAFPKGVPTQIKVVNPDGGQANTTFTR